MGRRAKKAPVQTKKRVTLAKRFKCPFCANEDVVECKMDNRKGTGSLECRMCSASFQMNIHHLHEPIDVFSEWLDECEAAEKRGTAGGGGLPGASTAVGGGLALAGGDAARGYDYDSDEEDDELLGNSKTTGNEKGNTTFKQHSSASLGLGDSDDDSD
mmetsp:Transcript_27217/g.31124  ORF Transcript_27217/g.31124 Transcript_27217/m.31124 type:complete len:158 (+) Transcript_27217:204-677(+)